MAIKIESKTNVSTADPDFLHAKILDDTGTGNGTPVSAQVYQDFHQFFDKILALASIIANNQLDNETNGYQYVQALQKLIALGEPGNSNGVWINAGTSPVMAVNPSLSTGSISAASGDILINKYKLIGRTLFWQFQVATLTIASSPTIISVTMPAALASTYKFANINMQMMGVYNIGSSLVATTGFDPIVTASPGVEKMVHLSLPANAAFTNGTNNQSFSFSIVAELTT